VPHVEHFANFR